MNPVFLSASVPDPRRHPRYFETADTVAIRDAITALVQVVTPVTQLVFGGHPAITPMVARIAQAHGTLANVTMFQSAIFQPMFPRENAAFTSLEITPPVPPSGKPDRDASLALMRERMLKRAPFAAAFFIGGMEGVEDEYRMVRGLDPAPPCYPVATTGGATFWIARENERALRAAGLADLLASYEYFGLFRRLLTRA